MGRTLASFDDLDLAHGDAVKEQTECTFALTGLLPLLVTTLRVAGEQDFTVTVTDEAGQTAEQLLKFAPVK